MEPSEWIDLILKRSAELRLGGVSRMAIGEHVVELRPPDAMPGEIGGEDDEDDEDPQPRLRTYSASTGENR